MSASEITLFRPQGAAGPAAASKAFLGAVPDLRIAVVQRLVLGDRVVSHLHFTGHFTGAFLGTTGTGQSIDLIATDILRVSGCRITDNWHLEDIFAPFRNLDLGSISSCSRRVSCIDLIRADSLPNCSRRLLPGLDRDTELSELESQRNSSANARPL